MNGEFTPTGSIDVPHVPHLDTLDAAVLVIQTLEQDITSAVSHMDDGVVFGPDEVERLTQISDRALAVFVRIRAAAATMLQESVEVSSVGPETPEVEEQLSMFTKLERELLHHALSQSFIRHEEMRRVLPSMYALSPEEYDEFKSKFPKFQESIVTRLAEEGITITWDRLGQARGVRYLLIAEDDDRQKLEELLAANQPTKKNDATLTRS